MTTTIATTNAYDRAIEKLDLLMPEVVWLDGDDYAVLSTSDGTTTYHVILGRDAKLFDAVCTCRAGQEGHLCCVHRAAAHRHHMFYRAALLLDLPVAPDLTLAAVEAATPSTPARSVVCDEVCKNALHVSELCQDCYSELLASDYNYEGYAASVGKAA